MKTFTFKTLTMSLTAVAGLATALPVVAEGTSHRTMIGTNVAAETNADANVELTDHRAEAQLTERVRTRAQVRAGTS